jgi:hypothetical protein
MSISEIPRELDRSNIENAISDYLTLLNQLPLHIKSENVLDFLTDIKRKELNCGPYPHVTLFESANRIMTDLVILYGVKELLNGKIKDLDFEKYQVEFGTENFNDNDIFAQDKNSVLVGEAFNVAKSFFQSKKAKSLKKLRGEKNKNKILLLLYNADAVEKNYIPKLQENEFHLPIELKF